MYSADPDRRSTSVLDVDLVRLSVNSSRNIVYQKKCIQSLLPVKFGILPIFDVISAVKLEYCCSYDSINEAMILYYRSV